MQYDVYRLIAACVVALSATSAAAQFGGMGGAGFQGGAFPAGGLGGGAWRAGGGIAGGGWHRGGFTNRAGFPLGGGFGGAVGPSGVGFAPGIGFVGPSNAMLANRARQGGFTGFAPGWPGGFPAQATGFGGGLWSNTHPYGWCNGHWQNHRYGNGFGGFGGGNYPLGWGLGGWGTGNQWYNSGYVPYYNPYHIPVVAGPYSYGKPIPVPVGAKLSDTTNPDVALAIDKFRSEDYAGALAIVDGVIRVQPFDAAAHELRSLTLFALAEYQQAAATIHSVLAVGPGWDWTTLSSVYSDMEAYQSQLAALEKYVAGHPRQADARFLLAYHYLTAGHTEAAKEQLEQVVALVPSDKLAAKLLRMVGRDPGTAQADTAQPAAAAPPAPDANLKPVDPAALVGDWHAKRDDGSAFELDLKADGTFTWKMTKTNQALTISGKYTLEKATLTLAGANQGSMVAQVTVDGGNRFTFKPQGGPVDDPGLTFTK